jgi:hypothetical protein
MFIFTEYSRMSAVFTGSPRPVKALFIQNLFCVNYIQKTACRRSAPVMLSGYFKLALPLGLA